MLLDSVADHTGTVFEMKPSAVREATIRYLGWNIDWHDGLNGAC